MCIAIRKNIHVSLNTKPKMEIINIIYMYTTIGILFCIAVDYAYWQKDQGNMNYQHMPEKGFSNFERVMTIILWPWAILVAVKQIIKDFKNRL